jgi:HSP20 family molecular chaperone IbpA
VLAQDLNVEQPNANTVRISGQVSEEHRVNNESKYYFREIHKSRFSREIVLPNYIEGEPEAALKDGILTLKWKHNAKKLPKTKKIDVKTG